MKKILIAVKVPVISTILALAFFSLGWQYFNITQVTKATNEATLSQMANSDETLKDVAYLQMRPYTLVRNMILLAIIVTGGSLTGVTAYKAYKKSLKEEEK